MSEQNSEILILHRELLRFGLIVISSWLAIWLDLFGAGDALRATSQDTFYSVISPSLPVSEEPARSPLTSIVLAIDQDLTTWPMSRAEHAENIDEIADAQPLALLIDFVFLGASEQDADLINTLEAAAHQFPVYAALPDGDGSILLADSTEQLYSRFAEAGVRLVDVTLGIDKGDTLATEGEIIRENTVRTPAGLAMRDAWCQLEDCHPLADRTSPREIVWRSPAHCALPEKDKRCAEFRSISARTAATLWQFIQPKSAPPLAAQGLLPFTTHTVTELRTSEAITGALQGSLVYYGASFRAAADNASSPVYGGVPGVMAHAALAENYVVWGDRAYKRALPFGLNKTQYELLLVVALSAFVIGARILVFRSSACNHPSARALIFWPSAAAFTTGLLIAYFESQILHTSPEHWLISPFVIASYGLMAWVDIKHDLVTRVRLPLSAIWRWIHRVCNRRDGNQR
ncbi:MAG: hypothetical protein Hals2KO_28900 [Halioglobus sp.]